MDKSQMKEENNNEKNKSSDDGKLRSEERTDDASALTSYTEAAGIPIEKFGAVGGDTDDSQAFIHAIRTVPDGTKLLLNNTYTVSNIMDSSGDTIPKKGITFSGVGNASTLRIKPEIQAIREDGAAKGLVYAVKDYYEEYSLTALKWKLREMQLHTGKIYEYLAIPDRKSIPSSLKVGTVLRGKSSRVELEVSGIDVSNPDGEGTARIYFFEGRNIERNLNKLNRDSMSILAENLQVKPGLGRTQWMLDFSTKKPPSFMQPNRKLIQSTGKTARIHSVGTYTANGSIIRNVVFVDSFPPGQSTSFPLQPSPPLDNNKDIQVRTYQVASSSFGSLNKMENIRFENLTFDGCNHEVALKLGDSNDYNILYLYASRNTTIQNCTFKNAIAGAIHIGGAGNVYSQYTDIPHIARIDSCLFENNGRNDIEIIHGSDISITNCTGDGTLDIEPNDDQVIQNIAISNCSFAAFTPYSPSHISSTSKITAVNCFFDHVISQVGANSKISSSYIHKLSPYNGNSLELNGCNVNRWDEVLGECVITLQNCEMYDLPRVNSGSVNIGTKSLLRSIGSIIDLSLVGDMSNNAFGFDFMGSTIISLTNKVTIHRSYVNDRSHFRNTILQNVSINNGNQVAESVYEHCRFLMKNDQVSLPSLSGTGHHIFQGCYIQGSLRLEDGSVELYDCVLDGQSKPVISAEKGLMVNGCKSDRPQGIDWYWTEACRAPDQLKFNNICVSKDIPGMLGISNGSEPISTRNVSAGCTALYMNDTAKHASVLIHSNNALRLKHLDYGK